MSDFTVICALAGSQQSSTIEAVDYNEANAAALAQAQESGAALISVTLVQPPDPALESALFKLETKYGFSREEALALAGESSR